VDRQCPSCGGFCKKSGCERENVKPEDVWQRAMKNALVYGTGFVRFDSMGGISVVDPKDYHYLEKKEWVGLDKEMMRNTTLQFNQGALWAERYLKEKNT
jgi:hypothetical protein